MASPVLLAFLQRCLSQYIQHCTIRAIQAWVILMTPICKVTPGMNAGLILSALRPYSPYYPIHRTRLLRSPQQISIPAHSNPDIPWFHSRLNQNDNLTNTRKGRKDCQIIGLIISLFPGAEYGLATSDVHNILEIPATDEIHMEDRNHGLA